MTPDSDGLEVLLRVVQRAMVAVHSAMADEVAREDEEERRRLRRWRLEAQLEMLEAARRAHRIEVEVPRLPAESVRELEERHGFVPGTYAAAVGEPSDAVVMAEQGLDLAVRVTRAQLAAEDGPIDRAFTSAVFSICCATVIGVLAGAPLGGLATNIVLRMANAAVAVDFGTTPAEIIEPISVRPVHEPADEVAAPLDESMAPLDEPVAAPKIPAQASEPDPDSPWRRPVDPPVSPPFDRPVLPPVEGPASRPFGGPGPF